MYDYFKVSIEPNLGEQVKRPLSVLIDPKTGEVCKKVYTHEKGLFVNETSFETCTHNGVTFRKTHSVRTYANGQTSTANYYHLYGSLHKYWNNGLHNYNRFTLSDAQQAIDSVCLYFGLNPELSTLHSLEFGVNLRLPTSANYFIDTVKSYKGVEYSIQQFSNGGKQLSFNMQRNSIKLYNKGLEYASNYGTPNNLMRYEIKATKAVYLGSMGIYTLNNLKSKESALKLAHALQSTFEQIQVFRARQNKSGLTPKGKTIVANLMNRDYYLSLNKDQRKRAKQQAAKYSEVTHLREQVSQLLESELNTILHSTTSTKYPRINRPSKNQNAPELTTRLYCYNGGISERQCSITGLSIEEQKTGSKFISAKQVGEQLAHKVRNIDSNPRNNLSRRILKKTANGQQSLFEPTEFLELTPQQREMLTNWKQCPIRIN